MTEKGNRKVKTLFSQVSFADHVNIRFLVGRATEKI